MLLILFVVFKIKLGEMISVRVYQDFPSLVDRWVNMAARCGYTHMMQPLAQTGPVYQHQEGELTAECF